MRHASGFSLIELSVVLVIAAAAATLAVPRLSSAIRTAGIKAAARDTAGVFNNARARALAGARDTTVLIDVAGRDITIEGTGKHYQMPEDLHLEVTAAESERVSQDLIGIRWFADGSATGGRVELRSGGTHAYTVDVDWLTGLARVLE